MWMLVAFKIMIKQATPMPVASLNTYESLHKCVHSCVNSKL